MPLAKPLRARVFLLRLFALFMGMQVLLIGGLYLAQSRDAQHLVIAQELERQVARSEPIEDAFRAGDPGGDSWSRTRAALAEASRRYGVRRAMLISPTGAVVAVAPEGAEAEGTLGPAVARVLRTEDPTFESTQVDGTGVYTYLSLVHLGGKPYVVAIESDPTLLNHELAALRTTSLTALAIGTLVAIPLFYLLGGRRLADRFAEAEDRAASDSLTGLQNHWSFEESLQHEIVRSQRFGEAFTLVLADVDGFKLVNDSQGHRQGDRLLVALAHALQGGRSVDRAFRVGGDEFAVIMPRTRLGEAARAVERLRASAARGMDGTTVSVGLAELDPASVDLDAATDAGVLRERADMALYEAKRRGRNQVVTFAEIGESTPSRTSAAIITGVRDLLSGGKIGAAFQPIWNLDTHRVIGYEGLARPAQEYGLAGPRDAFFGAARLGRVDELDAMCRHCVLAHAGGLPDDALLFLNVAPEVFDHGGEASRQLLHEVTSAGLTPNRVVVELTKNASERLDRVFAPVQELRDLGFGLALDDVGSGDGGLGLLGKVRPDFVKVDQEVVASAHAGGPGRAVLTAIVAYAAESRAIVIAEGIETAEMLQMVSATSSISMAISDRAQYVAGQGYLLGRPDTEPPWRSTRAITWPLASASGSGAVGRAPSVDRAP